MHVAMAVVSTAADYATQPSSSLPAMGSLAAGEAVDVEVAVVFEPVVLALLRTAVATAVASSPPVSMASPGPSPPCRLGLRRHTAERCSTSGAVSFGLEIGGRRMRIHCAWLIPAKRIKI